MSDIEATDFETPVHDWFGLSYAAYQVLNRTILQSMPVEWQRRFVAVMRELDHAAHDLPTPEYKVETGEWHEPQWVDPSVLKKAGWKYNREDRSEIFDADGNPQRANSSCFFVPCADPIPDYNRGRARVPLHSLEETAGELAESILQKGQLRNMTPEQIQKSVARQVSSSLRLDGDDTTTEDVLTLLRDRA